MIYAGIDIAKDKHDCLIISSEGEVLADVFTIPNSMEGFHCLLEKIQVCSSPQDKIKEEPVKLVTEMLGAPQRETVKVGLEATGHYSCNILGFLKNKGLQTIVINPLYTSLSRKSISLRKTKNRQGRCSYNCKYDNV